MDWMIYQIVAALIGAGNAILDKKLATRPNMPSVIYAASFGLVGVPVAVIGLVVLPPVPWTVALAGVVAGIVFIIAAWLYYRVMAEVEVSQVTMLMRLTSVQTLLLSAICLGERLTAAQYMAFVVTLLGGLLLVVQPGQTGLRLDKAAGLVLLVTTFLAMENILIAPIYREYSIRVGVVWENTGQVLGTLALIALSRDKRQLWQATRTGGLLLWGVLTGEQMVRLVMGVLSGLVIAKGVPLALVSALGGLRVMFTLLLAAWLLQERWPRETLLIRTGGIGCIALGLILML